MRCLSTGSASATTSSREGESRPWISARARDGQRERLRGARARTPGDRLGKLGVAFAGAAGAHQVEDRLDDVFADRRATHQPLRRHQVLGGHCRRRGGFVGAGGLDDDAPLGVAVGIADVDLHQEAVELGLGQRIGAFLLQRVLGREHVERNRQVVTRAGDRDVTLLHRLQQRRLGARAGAVDLVGHQQLCEDRPFQEAEGAFAVGAFLHHFGARECRRASGRA